MKVVINFDNDMFVAYSALMGMKGEDKEKLKAFLAGNESVEVEPSSLEDNEAEQALNLTFFALVLYKMAKDEGR